MGAKIIRCWCWIMFLACALTSVASDIITIPPKVNVEDLGVNRIELSFNDEFLIVTLTDKTVRLFDMRGEQPVQLGEFLCNYDYPGSEERYEYAFSHDGEKLAISYKGTVEIYRLRPHFSLEFSLKSLYGVVTALSFTADDKALVIAGSYKSISIINLDSRETVFGRALSSKIHGLAALKNNTIATISAEAPMLWRFSPDYSRLESNLLLQFRKLPTTKVMSSSDGETLYVEDQGTGFYAYNPANGEIIGQGISDEVQDHDLTISPDGSLSALVRLFEINIYSAQQKRKQLKKIDLENGGSIKIAFSKRNNNILYIGTHDGKIYQLPFEI